MNHFTYSKRLSIPELPSLEYRRLMGDLIEVFKIIYEIYDTIITSSLLTVDNTNITRSNTKKLKKNRVNFKPYQMFFIHRITNHWNRLPKDIVNADYINIFKK